MTMRPPSPLSAAVPRHRRAPARGMGALAIIGILVAMSALAAAVLRFGQQSQTARQQDQMGLQALSAARTGVEFGLYAAFRGGWSSCSSASQTLDLRTDLGMRVTVTCNSETFNEGESAPGVPRVVRVYTIDAVACNSSTCPDATAATKLGYVERRRQVQATN